MRIFEDLYTYLHTIHCESNQKRREEMFDDLFMFLEAHRNKHFPYALTRQAIEILEWYLDYELPDLGYGEEDLSAIREDYQELFTRLKTSQDRVRQLEKTTCQLIRDLRSGSIQEEWDGAKYLLDGLRPFLPLDAPFVSSLSRHFVKSFSKGLIRDQVFTFFKKMFDVLQQKNSAPPFLKTLANVRHLCDYYAQDYFWGKAVLVNVNQHGFVIPLWLQVDRTKTTAHVMFEQQNVDLVMQESSDAARLAACRYLQQNSREKFNEQISVRCHFPLPAVGYRDSSASLLLAIQIVGECLDIDPETTTAVSGEVDKQGNVLEVEWIPDKIEAVKRHGSIERFLIPLGNKPDTEEPNDVMLLPVQSFPEALETYYGKDALQQRLKWFNRRQLLKGIIASATAPFFLTGLRSFFSRPANPVSECDWRLLDSARELYQEESNYRHAVRILESILTRFQRDESSSDGTRIQAYALGQLGVIHLQQQQMQQSLNALNRAARLWGSIKDKENQADMLLRIGEVYRYTVAMDGSGENVRTGLSYYQQGHKLLHPSMPLHSRLEGRFYALCGFMHYWNGNYEQAEKLGRQALHIFEEPDSNWSYQTARQHLARTLIQTGQYDEAHEILQSGAELPCLKGPHDKARNALAFSELYLSLGEEAKGMEYAGIAETLCRDFNLQGQQRILTRSLQRYK